MPSMMPHREWCGQPPGDSVLISEPDTATH
jgi:hypothetical protein